MELQGYHVKLMQLRREDLEMVRQWRNDPKIQQFMLSQSQITSEQQQAWFEKINSDPRHIQFVIYYKDVPIGAANLKVILGDSLQNAQVIEPGLYIYDDKYRANLLAFAPTLLLNDYCFDTLMAQKLRAVVKKDNIAALNYNQKLGYQVIKDGDLVEIELDKLNYEKVSKPLKRLLSR